MYKITNMPVEIKGQQLRIRVNNPKKYSEILTDDVGEKGELQRIAGRIKRTNKWETQSWRLNLNDYSSVKEVIQQIKELKAPYLDKKKAVKLSKEYFKLKNVKGGVK
jgi:hypothetical protein